MRISDWSSDVCSSDLHLLRVAYGGMMGGITNIDQQGFSSAAFHAWPDMMKWDPYSGDYGMGFYGHAIASATYVVDHPPFGWLGFGGDVDAAKDRSSEEHTSELQSLMRISNAVFCLTK